MAQNEYRPVSWNGEPITNSKLNQMANNTQFLFERTPRIRYAAAGITRDSGLKMIVGKTPIPIVQTEWTEVETYFGDFFSAGCHPSINANLEMTQNLHRTLMVIRPLGSYTTYGEIDHRGFKAHVWSNEDDGGGGPAADVLTTGGFIHWQAVGY